MRLAGRAELAALLAARAASDRGPLYLVSWTSFLAEGWIVSAPRLELAGSPELEPPLSEAAAAQGVDLVWESPADVIPLPEGWEERCRPVSSRSPLSSHLVPPVVHFDPYSVVLRLVARGDEPDYLAALEYLRHGWVDLAALERLQAQALPRFTSRTLAQDPAEFRRKWKGLRQVWARHERAREDATTVGAGAREVALL